MVWVAALSVALAAEPPAGSEPVSEVAGMPDCPKALEMTPGEVFEAPEWLLDDNGIVKCRAIVEPYTSFANLLNIETDYIELLDLYRIDTVKLELERDHYLSRAVASEAALLEPPPFWDRPAVARWSGRLEVLAVMGASAWSYGQLQ